MYCALWDLIECTQLHQEKNSGVPINVDKYKILKYNVPKSIILLAM